MFTYIKRLIQERNALTQTITQLADRAATEDRDLTDTESAQIVEMQKRCADIDRQVEDHRSTVDSQRAWAKLQDSFASDEEATSRETRKVETRGASSSWGDTFTNSDIFKNYAGHGTSGRVDVGELYTRAAEDPILTTNLNVPASRFSPVPYASNTPLLDVCAHERVSSGSVEWIYWGPPDPVAAKVPEGTLKPAASMPATPKSSVLDTYAHWKAITRQALEDDARIRSIIETKLRNGIYSALEAAVSAALAADANIPAATVTTGASMLEAIRGAIGTVQAAGYVPNAVAVDPADWAEIDIGVMGGTMNGPTVNGNLFGLRVVAAPGLAAGTAYVGNFNAGVTIFERGTASVFLTDSHADNFLKNVLVLLAETRAKPEVTEPLALCKAAAGAP